jgi:hypothetical protein
MVAQSRRGSNRAAHLVFADKSWTNHCLRSTDPVPRSQYLRFVRPDIIQMEIATFSNNLNDIALSTGANERETFFGVFHVADLSSFQD